MDIAVTIILAVVASSGIWTFITFLLNRKDSKKNYVTKDDLKLAIGKCVTKEETEAIKEDTEALKQDTELLKKGLQAILRGQLVHDYNKWIELGYAPIYARENFENIYRRYHLLGANGVMDDLREKFLLLPTDSSTVVISQDDGYKQDN